MSGLDALLTAKIAEKGKENKPTMIYSGAPLSRYTWDITPNTILTCRSMAMSALTLTLTTGLANGDLFEVVFSSRDTATAFTAPEAMKFLGDDCNASGVFVPSANSYYILVGQMTRDYVVVNVAKV